MQIEEGKFYRTRDGQKVGPAAWEDVCSKYPWNIPWAWGPFNYSDKGVGCLNDANDDIIAEWTDEPATIIDDMSGKLDTIREAIEAPVTVPQVTVDDDDFPPATSRAAFRRIIDMLDVWVQDMLEAGDADKAIEYAVMMRECERMMGE